MPFIILLPIFILILFATGLVAFKKRPLFNFSLRAFSISFVILFLTIGAWFIIAMSSSGGVFIGVEEVNAPAGENIRYAEITEMELEEYPALKKAINEHIINKSSIIDVDSEEWERAKDLIEKKRHESLYLFSMIDGVSEEDLNGSIISESLRKTFESEGYPLSEYASVYKVDSYFQSNWAYRITEKQYLFSITDAEVEEELNRIGITTEGKGYTPESKEDLVPIKVKNSFISEGFHLPDDTRLLREDTDAWYVFFGGSSYRILREKGKLNVYTTERNAYEIWKEEGKLKVYETEWSAPLFKVQGKYYRIGFGHAD